VRALQQAKGFGGPVIVHAITRKGAGFQAAEDNDLDRFHAIGQINELTGEPLSAAVQATWTDAFAQELVTLGDEHSEVVALTAAMLHPTGLARFAAAHPDRVFDVGIAEQHAVASAAGLASAGLHPVVAIYSTFLNRAFDQMLMDVAMHKMGVTFVLDRAGITGPDGASHHGVWDVSICGLVPGLQLTSPRDRTRLNQALQRAVTVSDAPTVIRFSRDKVPDDIESVQRLGDVDILVKDDDPHVLLVGYGQMVGTAVKVAASLQSQGIAVTVVDPLWALPVSDTLVELATTHRMVVTLEDNLVSGGLGARLALALQETEVDIPIRHFGIPVEFIPAGTRAELLDDLGLTPKRLARRITEMVTHRQTHSEIDEALADYPGTSSETSSDVASSPATEAE